MIIIIAEIKILTLSLGIGLVLLIAGSKGQMMLCKSDDECNTDAGMRCQWFNPCEWGECTCKKGRYFNSPFGACSERRKVGESCNNGTQACYGNAVICTSGGLCECRTSYVARSDKWGCYSGTPFACKKPGEYCTNSYECCSNGNTCKSGVCTCAVHSVWWDEAMSCIHTLAQRNTAQDKRCTESMASSSIYLYAHTVCAAGLDCRSCPEHSGRSPLSLVRFCAMTSYDDPGIKPTITTTTTEAATTSTTTPAPVSEAQCPGSNNKSHASVINASMLLIGLFAAMAHFITI